MLDTKRTVPSNRRSSSSFRSVCRDSERERKHRFTNRVKTGCMTCKLRRVKCSEERPACYKCTSTGRNCDGYAPVPVSRRDLDVPFDGRASLLVPSQRLSGTGSSDGDERLGMHFEYFQSRVVPQTNEYLESTFWNRLVLQLCYQEPAVKHAVIALSSLHQYWELNSSFTSYEGDQNALRNHSKALQHANNLLVRAQSAVTPDKGTVVAILAVCILFVCFEYTVGRYQDSAIHLRNGRQILVDHFPPHSERFVGDKAFIESLEVVELTDVFYRLQVSTVCFSETKSAINLHQVFLKGKYLSLPQSFENIQEARRHLVLIYYRATVIHEVYHFPEDATSLDPRLTFESLANKISSEKQHCLNDLQKWSRLFKEMSARENEDENFEPTYSESVYDYVRVHYLAVKITVGSAFSQHEMAYDAFLEDFRVLVDYLKTMSEEREQRQPFSLEAKLLPFIIICAVKCRDPCLRRQAISLLAKCKTREGGWEGIASTRVAERLMILEEEGLTDMKSAEDVPLSSRISVLRSRVIHQHRKVELQLCRSRIGQGSQGNRMQEMVFY